MVSLECGRRAGGGKGRRSVLTRWIPLLLLLAAIPAAAQEKKEAFFFRGALYQDWLGLKSDGEDLFSRLSTRLNLALWNRPGNGWTVFLDVRNRFSAGAGVANRLLLYDARLAFDSRRHNFFGQLGLMNLYDTAGVGQLAGAMAGYKFGRFLSAGAYGGLQNDITSAKLDSTYQKFGVFFRYLGPGARQFSLSCNLVRFDGRTERPFIYSSLLLPLGRFLIVYGNGEFELAENTPAADRLSHLFVNARANLSRLCRRHGQLQLGAGDGLPPLSPGAVAGPQPAATARSSGFITIKPTACASPSRRWRISVCMFPARRVSCRTRASATTQPVSASPPAMSSIPGSHCTGSTT